MELPHNGRKLGYCVGPALAVLAFGLLIALSLPPGLVSQAEAKPGRGKLVVEVVGLPRGTNPNVRVVGPKVRGGATKAKVGPKGRLVFRKAPLGRWRIISKPVKVRKASGPVKRGAIARPDTARITRMLKRGRKISVTVDYATIRNPGVRVIAPDLVEEVMGDPSNPSSLLVYGTGLFRKGQIVTSLINETFPNGLLSRVVRVTRGSGSTELELVKASTFDVLPRASFNVPIADSQLEVVPSPRRQGDVAKIRPPELSCTLPGDVPVEPSIEFEPILENVAIKGEWNTVPFTDIPRSAKVEISFDAGVETTFALQQDLLSCSLGFNLVTIPFPIGPVPAYLAGDVQGRVELSATASRTLTAKARVKLGAEGKVGIPPVTPIFESSMAQIPRLSDLDATTSLGASVGAGMSVGVGVNDVADIEASASNTVGLSYQPFKPEVPRRCGLDATLGALSLSVSGGPLTVSAAFEPFDPVRLITWDECEDGTTDPPPEPPDPPSPPGMDPSPGAFKSVSAGETHVCGVRKDGKVACWYNNAYGQATPPPGTFKNVSAGSTHTCGVRTNNKVACWGSNRNSQGYTGQATPPSGDFKSVSAAEGHTCGVRKSGIVACWGYGASGQTKPPSGTFKAVSAGYRHTCGVKTNGRVACWGSRRYGQATPPSGTFRSVSAGTAHSCGVKTNGRVACWGDNAGEQTTPPSGAFLSLSASSLHNCGVRTDNTVVCWGTRSPAYPGSFITAPSGVFKSVSAGGWGGACAIRQSGQTVACW